MKEKINIEIEELRKRIKHKFYWGVWKGYAIEKKMREYAETGKAHDFEGRELSSEEIEFNKRELWINAPERFNKFREFDKQIIKRFYDINNTSRRPRK